MRLRSGVRFHMYSSSQPCGNASIKKWAKGGKTKKYLEESFPENAIAHSKLHITAREEGQVAPLCKRNIPPVAPVAGDSIQIIPNGLCTPQSREGCSMSCSDKIAKWNCLGVQGSIIIKYLASGPVYLKSITIGRKFSQLHCERALCCRMQGFSYPNFEQQICMEIRPSTARRTNSSSDSEHESIFTQMKRSGGIMKKKKREASIICACKTSCLPQSTYLAHHPVMLCTSIKFDDSAILTAPSDDLVDIGAQFEDSRSVVWWRSPTSTVEVIESSTGYLCDGVRESVSSICGDALRSVIATETSVVKCSSEELYLLAKGAFCDDETSLYSENWSSVSTFCKDEVIQDNIEDDVDDKLESLVL